MLQASADLEVLQGLLGMTSGSNPGADGACKRNAGTKGPPVLVAQRLALSYKSGCREKGTNLCTYDLKYSEYTPDGST